MRVSGASQRIAIEIIPPFYGNASADARRMLALEAADVTTK